MRSTIRAAAWPSCHGLNRSSKARTRADQVAARVGTSRTCVTTSSVVPHQRSRSRVCEGEEEAADAAGVVLEVRHEEDHGAAGQRVVEAQRGVVEHGDVGGQDELVDLGMVGHVDDPAPARVRAHGSGAPSASRRGSHRGRRQQRRRRGARSSRPPAAGRRDGHARWGRRAPRSGRERCRAVAGSRAASPRLPARAGRRCGDSPARRRRPRSRTARDRPPPSPGWASRSGPRSRRCAAASPLPGSAAARGPATATPPSPSTGSRGSTGRRAGRVGVGTTPRARC